MFDFQKAKLNLQLFSGDEEEKYKEYEDAFSETNEETNAYYDMIKGQQFDKLLDKEIQLENAKQQALKQTQNTLNASGFGSQGYGSSMQSSIYGRYMNAFNENQRDYETSIYDLESQRRNELLANQEEVYQQVAALISSSGSNMDRVNEYLTNIGLGSIDSDGNFVFGKKPDSMSQSDWSQLQYLYNLQKDSSDLGYNTSSSLEQLYDATIINSISGNVQKIGDIFKDEALLVWHHASVGDYKNGDSIKITNGKGVTIYLQWTKDGFRVINENDFNNSEHQYSLTSDKSSNRIYTQIK